MLPQLFRDDEHTAADTIYLRVLRPRKWIYLASAAAVIIHHGLYSANELTRILKFFSLPEWILRQGLILGLSYLLIQYALISFQLVRTYDVVQRERFSARIEHQISSLRNRLTRIQAEDEELQERPVNIQQTRDTFVQSMPDAAADEGARRVQHEYEIRVEYYRDEREKLQAELARVASMDPSARWGVKWSEAAIDALRISLPFASGAAALIVLLRDALGA